MKTQSNETVKVRAEYTDLYAGEANYTWVRRVELEFPQGVTDRAVMIAVKRAFDITGSRGETHNYGDLIEFRPRGTHTVVFISFTY